jgi:hypothetical protein
MGKSKQMGFAKIMVFKQWKSNQNFCTHLQWQYNSLFFPLFIIPKKQVMKKKTQCSNKSYAHNKQQMCSND